jgi:hypothetical protein
MRLASGFGEDGPLSGNRRERLLQCYLVAAAVQLEQRVALAHHLVVHDRYIHDPT